MVSLDGLCGVRTALAERDDQINAQRLSDTLERTQPWLRPARLDAGDSCLIRRGTLRQLCLSEPLTAPERPDLYPELIEAPCAVVGCAAWVGLSDAELIFEFAPRLPLW